MITTGESQGAKAVIFSDDFESGDLSAWTLVDADGDTHNWQAVLTETQTTVATSASYDNTVGALTPENWMISPAIDLTDVEGVELSYRVWGQDPDWASEHYKVVVSTTGNAVADFTATIHEETLPGSDIYEKVFDISNYVGETIYIAFVHYDCTDNFMLNIDDVAVSSTGGAVPSITETAILNVTGTLATISVTSDLDGNAYMVLIAYG